MNVVQSNVANMREFIQRREYSNSTVVDLFSAFYVISSKGAVEALDIDDRHVAFIVNRISNVPAGPQREFWLKTMFETYEKLLGLAASDPGWLLLKAGLVYMCC